MHGKSMKSLTLYWKTEYQRDMKHNYVLRINVIMTELSNTRLPPETQDTNKLNVL